MKGLDEATMIHAHRVLLAAAVLAACATGAAAGALRGPPRTARAATPSSRRETYVEPVSGLRPTHEKLQVSGAGSAVVNGVYQKVESSLYTGSSTVGSLMWRQMNPAGGYTDLCILHQEAAWWIPQLERVGGLATTATPPPITTKLQVT